MCAELGYNANVEEDVKEYRTGFEIIPPGWVRTVIIESEIVSTKSGTGKMLVLTNELQDGTGRHLTDRLNIINSSEKAQIIGRAALAKIAVSVGVKGAITNSNILHGRPYEVKVEIEEFESNTEPGKMLKSNRITDYRAIQSAPAAAAGTAKTPVGW